jgi:hypothetical protein
MLDEVDPEWRMAVTLDMTLDGWKLITDIAKWVIAGIAAVVSFIVIDVGRLKLEEFKAQAENQRLLLQAYLSATESVQPDIWKRKLRVLQTYSQDERIRDWAGVELQYVESYAEQDALYRETLKIASQLVRRSKGESDGRWDDARARFEQLYWADLPYARESPDVAAAMIDFRSALLVAEAKPNAEQLWNNLDLSLLRLSNTLRQSQPKGPPPGPLKPSG